VSSRTASACAPDGRPRETDPPRSGAAAGDGSIEPVVERAAQTSEARSERRFELEKELSDDGRFVRHASAIRRWVTADGSSGLQAEAGRYHLYVCLCCPWSHRVVIGRVLKGLERAISISYVDPFRDARGWAFTGGEFVDPLNGFAFLREAYEATGESGDHVTVPVLWDRKTGQIVNNESSEILRMLGSAFDALAERDVDLYPEPFRQQIDALNELIYENVNNGVYKAGFSTSQAAYEEAAANVFAVLDRLEERLGAARYLVGDVVTEADWRLFPTLVRFDTVYYSHFKCNRRRVVDYPNLWAYTRDLYQQPLIAGTVAMNQIKRHYYTTHDMINPSRIIPIGPDIDFLAPHGRG
jgi:putative glutathione S-transferase